MDNATIIKYSVAIKAVDKLVTRYDWLATSAEEAEQELAGVLTNDPQLRNWLDVTFPQAKGAALTFEATAAGGGNGHTS